MARIVIQDTSTGEIRQINDVALPFFPGFVQVDTIDDEFPPTLFYTGADADARYVNVAEISDRDSPGGVALRAASVAAGRDLFAPLAPGQHGRRKAIAEHLLATAGPWYLKRRNASEYRMTRDIGGGQYADFMLRRNFSAPGGYGTVHSLHDICVGFPLIPVAHGTTDTLYSGTWTATSALTTGTFPHPDYGYGAVTATVTTTAGSTSVAVTSSPLTPSSLYLNLHIAIPGAGAGGALYEGTVANLTGGGATIILNVAASTAVTGATATIYPGRRSNQTAGSTATYTSPAGVTRLGAMISTSAGGGLGTVSIDGSLTAANCLPTAQEVVDSGRYPASILTTGGGSLAPTTRVIDFYTVTERWIKWIALAENLTAGSHVVVFTVTDIKRPEATGFRTYVAGWGYGTGAESPLTPRALVFSRAWVGSDVGTHETAIEHLPSLSGATVAGFVGGNAHGYEDQPVDPTLVVDGVATTLTDDQAVLVADTATFTRSSNLYHPQNTATVSAVDKLRWTMSHQGLVVSQAVTWQVASVVSSAYLAQFSINSLRLDRAQLDLTDTVFDLNQNADGTYLGVGKNTGAAWWDADGDVAAAVLLPAAQQITGNWSETALQVTIRNFADSGGLKYAKLYARRIGNPVAGEVWASQATYLVGRLPGGAADAFPVTARAA